jgi:hypothetical protein
VTQSKPWAIIVGAATGVAAASAVVAWYIHSHHHDSPELSLQERIKWAHDKIAELEEIAKTLKKPLEAS